MSDKKWSVEDLCEFWARGTAGMPEDHVAEMMVYAVRAALSKAAVWIREAEGDGVADDFLRDMGIEP